MQSAGQANWSHASPKKGASQWHVGAGWYGVIERFGYGLGCGLGCGLVYGLRYGLRYGLVYGVI